MGEQANTIPPSGYNKLVKSDFIKGLIKSTGGLIVLLLFKMIENKFKLPTYNEIIPILEAGLAFFVSYLGINYKTNNVGEFGFGKSDKPVTTVPTKELKEVVAKADEAG